MTNAASAVAAAPTPKKRGPNTPEGKARSKMNALKHGLRARDFGILPEESHTEWAEHVRHLRAGYGPVDAAEEKLVTAIAVGMWNEIRTDRTLVETMAEIPPRRTGRSHGTNLQDPDHARSLGTAIRYMTAADMATQRAQRAFFQHRKAKQSGLILPAAEPAAEPANQNGTNEISREPDRPATSPAAVEPGPQECTNDFPRPTVGPMHDHLGELRGQIDRAFSGPTSTADRIPPRAAPLSRSHDASSWHAPPRLAHAGNTPVAGVAG